MIKGTCSSHSKNFTIYLFSFFPPRNFVPFISRKVSYQDSVVCKLYLTTAPIAVSRCTPYIWLVQNCWKNIYTNSRLTCCPIMWVQWPQLVTLQLYNITVNCTHAKIACFYTYVHWTSYSGLAMDSIICARVTSSWVIYQPNISIN